MRAIILAAGRGSRLGTLTEDRPKCLLPFGGRPLIDWQLDALAAAGVDDIIVIVGFNGRRVEAWLQGRAHVRIVHNPFYGVSDNLASLWLARDHFEGDVLVLNGDTLVAPEIVAQVLEEGRDGVNVTIHRKPAYDEDDMKVHLRGESVIAVGKQLADADAESIGLLLFRGKGTSRFRQTLQEMMHDPASVTRWFLSAVDQLAQHGGVHGVDIHQLGWCEVDYPEDLPGAEALVATWRAARAGALR